MLRQVWRFRSAAPRALLGLATLTLAILATGPVRAQFGGGGFGGGGGGLGGGGGGGLLGGGGGGGGVLGGGGGGGNIAGNLAGAGVVVDAEGVLKRVKQDPTGRLTQQRLLAAKASPDVREGKRSPMRKVALKRLEAAVTRQVNDNKGVDANVWFLAGLTRIQYVFYMPEIDDIVIAGPAEPMFMDAEGEVRGVDTLRPSLLLEDLIVAMRAFPPGQPAAKVIGCSIDPTQQGIAQLQEYLKQVGRQITPGQTNLLVDGLKRSLGMQTVTIQGVSPQTRFAKVMVGTDYRMKMIGIGLERPEVKIPSYVELESRPPKNALVRWFFVPHYECVRASDDGLAMEMVGLGVKLAGADEVVQADGTRTEVGQSSGASKRFVEAFTAQYEELAAREPAYAHLRNLIDLSIAAAFMQQQDYYGRANWRMAVFADEQVCPCERYTTPKQVESAVNAVWKGNRLYTPIGGGVNIVPTEALATDRMLPDEDGKLAELRKTIDVSDLPADRWWWD